MIHFMMFSGSYSDMNLVNNPVCKFLWNTVSYMRHIKIYFMWISHWFTIISSENEHELNDVKFKAGWFSKYTLLLFNSQIFSNSYKSSFIFRTQRYKLHIFFIEISTYQAQMHNSVWNQSFLKVIRKLLMASNRVR